MADVPPILAGRVLHTHRIEWLLPARWAQSGVRPTASGSPLHGIGLSRGAPRDGPPPLDRSCASRVQLVFGRESAAAMALRSDHGRLPRRTARRSGEREPRRGIDAVVSVGTMRNAFCRSP